MTKHQKRMSVPNSWPVERKTETFTVKADAGPHGEAGVPLLIVLRDVLGYADSRKEARYALDQDSVEINGTPVADEERPVGMFDILSFTERDEYYRVFPGEGGRLSLTPIDADSAGSKLGKIVNKQHVPGGNVQLTLHDGQTLVVDEDAPYDGSDSVVVSNDETEVVAHFEYEEGALVTAVDGAHAGEVGHVGTIQVTPGSADNNVLVEQDGGDSEASAPEGGEAADGFETIEDYVVVIDENFTSDEDGERASSAADETEAGETEAGEVGEAEADGADDEDLMAEAAEDLEETADEDLAEDLVDTDDEDADDGDAEDEAADEGAADEEGTENAEDEAAEEATDADEDAAEEEAADEEAADEAASNEAGSAEEVSDEEASDDGDEATDEDGGDDE